MPAKTNTTRDKTSGERNQKESAGQVAKIGNLGADFELKYADDGRPYARSRLAVNRPVKDGDWSGEKATDWYGLTVFDELGEHAAECLHKGDRVLVIGRGEVEHWADEQGRDRESRTILANGIGPDLRWATVAVQEVNSTRGGTGEVRRTDF
jgi:single-strand DNA-binding protein